VRWHRASAWGHPDPLAPGSASQESGRPAPAASPPNCGCSARASGRPGYPRPVPAGPGGLSSQPRCLLITSGVCGLGCCLTYNAFEPFTDDAGAERASSAAHHPFCDRLPMLRAKSPGRPDNGACGGAEPVNECTIISRSVIGALGDSGSNCNWAYSNRTNIGPEFVFVLQLLFHLHRRSQGTARAGR
jgi:hypothetical protein